MVCDFCEEDCCTNCDALVVLTDDPFPMGIPDRALKTVPKGILEVRPSNIHGLGVFSLVNIKAGVKLGPYVGKISRVDSTKGYSWKLHDGRLVDAADESVSNYMRYVNYSRNVSEQNLVAFQHKGNLYYRTCRNIKKSEELLVHYGTRYAKLLGIDNIKYFEPEQEDLQEFFCCEYCHKGLSTAEYRDSHQKRCQFRPNNNVHRKYKDAGFECKYCHCIFNRLEFLQGHEKKCPMRILKSKENNNNRRGDEATTKKYRNKFKKHSTIFHNIEEAEIFHCDKCDFETNYRFSLKRHQRLHSNCHWLRCQLCQKGFIEKRTLDNHILKNHREFAHTITSKLHCCQHCQYKTVFKTILNRHLLRHSKENCPSFTCLHCKYATYYKSHLRRHLLIHSQEGVYICTLCKKNFNQKNELDGHILHKHSKHKALLKTITHKIRHCKHCNYKTINSNHFKNHLKTTH